MRFVYLAFIVICAHLVLLWWAQVSRQGKTPEVLPVVFHLSPVPAPNTAPVVQPTPKIQVSPHKQPMRQNANATQVAALTTPPVQGSINSEIAQQNKRHDEVMPVELGGNGIASTSGPTQKTENTSTNTIHATKPNAILLPSSSAEYLNNPQPTYPVTSLRLGEQGKVVVRVLISKDGKAAQGEITQSSGFDRLDRAALRTVLGWRYIPGQTNGQPQDMWFDVPITFRLN